MKTISKLCLSGENIKNAFIKFGNIFIFLKTDKQKLDKRQVSRAVRENMPICITNMEGQEGCIQICPTNIFYPDMFLKKRDRVKKLCLELQNAY